ncbi:hypothetical protein [uncultured Stenotrophomonas sp.]|uniref:hypothetical protein n=1 Tax=uncultured Stenotrophomonas sp. TaxID=165438 RepID=UPI0025E10640|nr:hypothetical protein [uncultured Stenotrophomonas sp.]
MDMQAGGGIDPPAAAETQELTFQWLYGRVQGLVEHSIYPKAGKVEAWAFRVGVSAGVAGLLVGLGLDRWLSKDLLLPVVAICLGVEICGLVIGGILTACREYRQYVQPRLSHSREMDGDFLRWQSVISDLRCFPKKQRQQRLKYVSSLRSRMMDRMDLVYGGLQRLGPFPLLVALFLQLRSWRADGWASAFDIGWVGALLIFAMGLLYLVGCLLIAQRMRLDTYVALLEGSVQEPEAAAQASTPVAQGVERT